MTEYHAVVCGLGAMGSSALHHLARRGRRVVGLERYTCGHDRGSSHGGTRIIRLGYFEHPSYVPLLRRCYELWHELEASYERKLLHITGILEIGTPESSLVKGTLASARLHRLPHEVLTSAHAMHRFPAFRLPENHVAVLQPDGGFLEVEQSIEAMLALARAAGAEVREGERVHAIEPRGRSVLIHTSQAIVEAETAIVTVGPWTASLLPRLPLPLRVTRQVIGWFETADADLFSVDRFPVFIIESRHGIHYGIPPHRGRGLKLAKHHHSDETVDPERWDRGVSGRDEGLIRAAVADYIPQANGRMLDASTCLYTMTPDGDFLLDRPANCPGIIVASPCSGHGFKFAPVIGEILADLATTGRTRHDIDRFRLSRFGG